MLTAPAFGHDAKPTAALPQGWSYPFACCANYDCKEVQQSSISERRAYSLRVRMARSHWPRTARTAESKSSPR